MAIEIALTGTRADLIEHLQAKATEHKVAARSMSKDAAAKQLGIAEGLEEAASDLGRWVDSAQPQPANGQRPREYAGISPPE